MLIGKVAREMLSDYLEAIDLVEPVSVPRNIVGDIDDDQVIAVAVEAGAVFVSDDRKHLLPLGSHQGIGIVDAAEALSRRVNWRQARHSLRVVNCTELSLVKYTWVT